MAGNVYIFNATAASMTLILNNTLVSATALSGATQSGSYVPNSIAVSRNSSSSNSGTSQFGGTNVLIVSYSGTSQKFEVDIDPTANPIASDLQLYLFYNEATLVSQGGQGSTITGGSQVTITGTSVSQEEVRHITGGQ